MIIGNWIVWKENPLVLISCDDHEEETHSHLAANFHLKPETPNELPQLNPNQPHLHKDGTQCYVQHIPD